MSRQRECQETSYDTIAKPHHALSIIGIGFFITVACLSALALPLVARWTLNAKGDWKAVDKPEGLEYPSIRYLSTTGNGNPVVGQGKRA